MKALILKSVIVTALAFALVFSLGWWLALPFGILLLAAIVTSAALIATVVTEELDNEKRAEAVVVKAPKEAAFFEVEVELDPMDPHGDGTLQEGDMLFELMKVLMRGGHNNGIGVAQWNPETEEWEFDIVESPESSLTDAEIAKVTEEWRQ